MSQMNGLMVGFWIVSMMIESSGISAALPLQTDLKDSWKSRGLPGFLDNNLTDLDFLHVEYQQNKAKHDEDTNGNADGSDSMGQQRLNNTIVGTADLESVKIKNIYGDEGIEATKRAAKDCDTKHITYNMLVHYLRTGIMCGERAGVLRFGLGK